MVFDNMEVISEPSKNPFDGVVGAEAYHLYGLYVWDVQKN